MSSLSNLYSSPYNKKFPVFALYRFIHWKLIRLLKLKEVKYRLWNNRSIFLNYNSFQSMWIMYNYIVDWEEFNLISRYIQSGDEVFDVGANMGFYTIWMSKFIGNGKIHSFEPDHENFKKLKKNISINKLGSMIVANKLAVSDVNGMLAFTEGLDGENHIVDPSDKKSVTILSQRIEGYVSEHQIDRIAYMKIDVEGFEYAVLKGAEKMLIDQKIDIIQLEINKTINNSGKTIDDLLLLLNFYQYRLCCYNVTANYLEEICFTDSKENYFAVSHLQKINDRLKLIAL